MPDLAAVPGLEALWSLTKGDERVCVAIIDGAIDLGHAAFAGADLKRAPGAWADEDHDGSSARHGTQVASVLFGQHDGPVMGVAPDCRGLSAPGFSDRRRGNSQLEMARAIETAVEAGASIINISGGELSRSGEAEDLLDRAVRMCAERNVLIVAAAGNDGCFCDHVPAALPSVLAVGAHDDGGDPLAFSNWGATYRDHGLLAPGQNIMTAVPGGATALISGTSFATPIVAGVAALLLALQLRSGADPDPLAVGDALLASSDPCALDDDRACRRFLTGKLNIQRAVRTVMGNPIEPTAGPIAGCGCEPPTEPQPRHAAEAVQAGVVAAARNEPGGGAEPVHDALTAAASRDAGIVMSAAPADGDLYVYALGVLGYDFGTEARRDSFKQLMAPADIGGTIVPANPYDARQMVDHLVTNPSEATALIWTLNLELTPIYAVEAVGPYAADIYALLTRLLSGEVAATDVSDYIERVSIPGRRTGRTIELFSGQVVPLIEVQHIRGLYGWQINSLLDAATTAAKEIRGDVSAQAVGDSLREFLARVYYDLRNLGAASRDRALNFAATNAFQAASTFASAVAAGMALDTIDVEKSPFCRMDSDCWDVKLRFFDPENDRRARKVFRFTIDVSDQQPVTLGEVRTWSEAS